MCYIGRKIIEELSDQSDVGDLDEAADGENDGPESTAKEELKIQS